MENNNQKRKKRWEDYVVDLFLLLLKPLTMFSDWLTNLIVRADTELKRTKDYVVILVVMVGLISIMIIIPTLNDMMKEETTNETLTAMDNFTLCLTIKGVSLYGAAKNVSVLEQKYLFGGSFKYLIYINCLKEGDKCGTNKIEINPTWIIENKKYEKVLSIEELGNLSGCELNEEEE